MCKTNEGRLLLPNPNRRICDECWTPLLRKYLVVTDLLPLINELRLPLYSYDLLKFHVLNKDFNTAAIGSPPTGLQLTLVPARDRVSQERRPWQRANDRICIPLPVLDTETPPSPVGCSPQGEKRSVDFDRAIDHDEWMNELNKDLHVEPSPDKPSPLIFPQAAVWEWIKGYMSHQTRDRPKDEVSQIMSDLAQRWESFVRKAESRIRPYDELLRLSLYLAVPIGYFPRKG